MKDFILRNLDMVGAVTSLIIGIVVTIVVFTCHIVWPITTGFVLCTGLGVLAGKYQK